MEQQAGVVAANIATTSTTVVSARESRLAEANVELAFTIERLRNEKMDLQEQVEANSRKIKSYNTLMYRKEKMKVLLMVNKTLNWRRKKK